jgi:hypothetical protein
MSAKTRTRFVFGLTLVAVVFTLCLAFLPADTATAAVADTRYAAGNKTAGTSICNCPVTVGDCVCAYTDPKPAEPAQPGTIAIAAN